MDRGDQRDQLDQRDRRPWLRLASSGVELAAAVGGFAVIGHLIDRSRGTHPKGLLVGAVLGLIGGMYNLIKASLAASRQARDDDQEEARRKDEESPR